LIQEEENMRRYILAVILILASCSIFAACGSNTNLTNAGISCVSGLSGTPANVTAILWIQGLYNAADATGTDSTGVPTVDTTCAADGNSVLMVGSCNGDPAGYYLIYADWINLAYDGCPLAGAVRAVLLAYDNTGKYTLQSRLQTEDWTNWDAIGTIPAAVLSAPTGTPAWSGDEAAWQADITWGSLAGIANGNYNGAAPGTPLITGFRTYFLESAAAPANFATSAWTAGTLYGYGAANLTNMSYPALGSQANHMYMSRSIVIDGIELPYVSTNYITLFTPSGAPVITSASAIRSGLNTNVTWTSADESKVTGYQVMWAPVGSSDFSAVGSFIQPAGNNHTYTSSVRIPATGSYVVKIGASMIDGATEYSSPANVTAGNVIKNKSRVTPN